MNKSDIPSPTSSDDRVTDTPGDGAPVPFLPWTGQPGTPFWDILSNPKPAVRHDAPAENGPPDVFYAHFNEHVIPRLNNLIIAEARVVACGQQAFLDAWTAVMTYARKHGARLFTKARHEDLGDWVTTAIADATMQAEAEGWADWPNLRPGTPAWKFANGGKP